MKLWIITVTDEELEKNFQWIRDNCSEFNYDGYDGDPVSENTIQLNKKFIKLLPKKFRPELAPLPCGNIDLCWYHYDEACIEKRNDLLILSIYPKGHGDIWCKSLAGNVNAGKWEFDYKKVPKEFLDIISYLKGEL